MDPGYPKALVKCWAVSIPLGLYLARFDQDIWKIWSHSTRANTAPSAGVQQDFSAEGEGRVCSQSCSLMLVLLALFDPQTKAGATQLWEKAESCCVSACCDPEK